MSKLIVFLALIMTAFQSWAWNLEMYLMDRSYRTMQYGVEHAVHDGALQVDLEYLAEGFIDFDEPAAEAAIIESLKMNLGVDDSLTPIQKTFFKDKLKIHEIIYIDDNYETDITFPYILNYELPDGQELEQVIFGPSVVLIIEANVIGSDDYEPFVAIQEYKY